ncbi:uncharacterized protein LOC141658837 [Silene latifolia]|uniref:uncharacterized protein LOC141658837 n=1 Tax=Silene latifolia TaxID=37657 RepID=UPI003D76D5A0
MEDIGITSLSEVRSREEVNGEGREGEKRQKIEEEQEPEEGGGGGGGGLLDNLLAKLSSPRAAPSHPIDDGHDLEAADAAHLYVSNNGSSEDGVKDDGGTAGAGGGVINNIISSIFHRGGGGGENGKQGDDQGQIEENKVEGGETGDKDLSKENGGRNINGASIISNLVPDDVAPASDEASILIHSVVHD